MAQSSEDELYQRADNLLRHAGQHFQSLFFQRWEHLTQSKWNGKDSVQPLVDMLGVQFSKMLPHQKSEVKKGLVEEWDITLLSRLLIHFSKDKEVKQAIQSIATIRNKLAHNVRKKLNFEEYSSTERLLKTNLIILGMEEKVIQNIINQAEATSMNSALEQLKKLQTEGDNLFNKKNYEKAIQVYSDAILLPNLPPGHLSVLYEKRGFCQMSKSKAGKNAKLKEAQMSLAFSDGEKAIELNNNSWKGHHILAQVYQGRSKLDQALVHYRRAIAIAPGQPEVKSDLDICTILAGKVARDDHLDPRQMPMNLSERVKHFNEETSHNISEKDFLKFSKLANELVPGQDHVATGHQHLAGWGVPQNYSEAAKHYAKARLAGNAEGIYNLALLYKGGLGVKQDIPYAIELYTEAAEKPSEIDKKFGFANLKNVGVAEAQHSLGLLHEEGIGVPKDLVKAAYWYKKSADNGCGNAANNLAILYSNGTGVPLDEKMAEMYWKIGVDNKNMNAAYSLHVYYFERMEPQLAKSYFNRAIELGHDRLKTSRAQVFQAIDEMEKKRAGLEGDIKAFEEANKLDTRGLTFSERMKREASSKSPEMAKIVEYFNKVKIGPDAAPQIWAGQAKNIDIDELLRKAKESSKTAKSILDCLVNNARFIELWEQGPPRNPVEIDELISTLYFCLSTQSHHFKVEREMQVAVLLFLNKLFQSLEGKKSKLDMQLRLCRAFLQFSLGGVDKLQAEMLEEGIRRYPDEIPLYHDLTCAYGNLKDYRKGLEVANNGLRKEPNNPGLLYMKAVHIRLMQTMKDKGKYREKVREAYKQFIEHAPVDHRKLPEAYYCIGVTYMIDMHMKIKGWEKMLCHYYELGEEVEKMQLSCYLPYESSSKLMLKNIVMMMRVKNPNKGRTEKATKVAGKAETVKAIRSEEKEKVYLKDPRRIEMIKTHREALEAMRKLSEQNNTPVPGSHPPKLVHKIPKAFTDMKIVTLQEMNPTKDLIYEGRILSLTIIEEPLFGYASIHLIAEDDNGNATRLYIYNVEQNEHARKTFGVGAKLAVINPYMRIAQDLTNGIRVDDPKCIIHNEGVKDMCRYCGKEGAKSSCSRCKKAKYCGKNCQEMDWKVLKHKLVCWNVNGK